MNVPAFRLFVQSNPQDVRNAVLHYQDAPYPGGLTFLMEINEPDILIPIVKKFDYGKRPKLARSEACWVFMLLDSVLGLKRLRGDPKFWLNNITGMEVTKDAVSIQGICSPHVSPQ